MSTEAPHPQDRPSKVLVVDDNAQNLELLVEYLDTIDVETATATDGVQALEMVGRFESHVTI